MQNQAVEKKGSKQGSGKRHYPPIETPPSPPNPDPPQPGAVRPPYEGPKGGQGHHGKK